MRGFLHHFWTSLKLNYRNPQAVVFGYLVPIFFLFAYGSAFGSARLMQERMGQLLTICVLGGACFGMPVTFVSERERGVWRRYRLTPLPTWAYVVSLMLARYVIVLTSGLLLFFVCRWYYRPPDPLHPMQMLAAFTFVTFAFLGIGLVISMVANSSGAVQALGQAVFLPVILIGGVGVPLRMLQGSPWALHASAFLPGRYAVQALDWAYFGAEGLWHRPFNVAALALIGVAGFLAGWKLFRWENQQQNRRTVYLWVGLALATWLAVGAYAEWRNLTKVGAGAPPPPKRSTR
jgi:ABC-type multidrug transport system permease subunit